MTFFEFVPIWIIADFIEVRRKKENLNMNNKFNLPKHKKLILFDGVCNMCDSTVKFIIKNDRKEQFVFASLQGETAKYISEIFDMDTEKLDSIVLYDCNRIYEKSTAVIKIGLELRFPINLSIVLLIIPRIIRNSVYDYIKQNRYKWYGKKTQCSIPSPKLKARFLP